MIYWACIVIVLHATFSVKADLHNLNSYQDNSKCQYAAGLRVDSRTTELECCETIVHDYYNTKFEPRNRYLSTFLESLQTWNCPQFQQECKRPTFNYTDFTSLIYLRFCNRSQMKAQCYDHIQSIVTKQNNGINTTNSKFNRLVSKLNLTTLSEEDLVNPCVQVAMYDSPSGSQGHYHEIIEPVVPFCWFVWCGFDENTFIKKHVTPWTCMSSRCRLTIVIYLVGKICFAFAIVICNATILAVLSHKKQDVKSIYRLSLAVADIIMGIFVIPIITGTQYNHLVQSPPFNEVRNVTDYLIANDSSLPMQPDVVESKDLLPDTFSSSYLSAFTIFNTLSLSVSLSSLIAASFDRYVAISRPLRYNKLKAIFAAKITVVCLWIAGLIFAVVPIAISDTSSSSLFAISELAGRKPMNVVIAIGFFLAFVLMWSSVIATYIAARPSLRRHDWQRDTNDEMRLLGTLGIMIAVFTFCVVPEAIVLMIGVYLPHIDLSNPLYFDVVAAMQFMFVRRLIGIVLVSNSLWNCFIYSIRETSFRSATKSRFRKIAQYLKLDQAWKLVSQNV